MADLFKKKTAEQPVEAPVAADANAPEAPEVKPKKEKKSKQKFLEPNKMNFLEQYQIVVEGKKKNIDLQKILKPLIAVAIVVLVIFVLLEVVLLGMKAKGKSLEKYINDETNVASYNEAVATKEKTDEVNVMKSNIEACMGAIDSYPNVGTQFFATIATCATNNSVTVETYGYSNDNGYLTLSCKSNSTSGISNFVRDIVKTGLFDSVNYVGFNGTAEDGHTFTISCVCLGDSNAKVVEPITEATTEAVEG